MKQSCSIDISVILAVYNGEKYIEEAIKSISNQTFENFELIIIDDGSVDSTKQIIFECQKKDSRIILHNNDKNEGLVYSLNKGLAMSKGKYIARMDGDDIAINNRLETQYNYMESHPEIGICGAYIKAFYEGTNKNQIVKFANSDKGIRAFAFFQAPFCHPTVMFRKELLEKNNLQYSNKYYRAEDYNLWIELLEYTQAANITEVLLNYRKHDNNETVLGEKNVTEKIEMLSKLQSDYLKQNNIFLDREEMIIYTSFVDRSIPFDLTRKNQKKVEAILKKFLSQLYIEKRELYHDVIYYLSTICFYKFFIAHKLPKTKKIQKLYFKGMLIYLKRKMQKGYGIL